MRTKFDIGQIIRDWGSEFIKNYNPVPQVRKSFAAMAICRTRELGGHVEVCPECGEVHISYNSCRDRNCPKCQNKNREEWVDCRKEELLPKTTYYHVVFTIPDCLHPIAMSYQKVFYSCMFHAVSKTLGKFFAAKKLQGGITSILHTWGSKMFFHPHIHCIVPGGGIDKKGNWHSLSRVYAKDSYNFLFSVCALSKVFRAKFLDILTRELKVIGISISQDIRKKCIEKNWVVYCKPPVSGPEKVIEYLGRYAYRVAISNSRILDYKDGMVTYDWKDYKDKCKHKQITMHAIEFLRLFSLHIVPAGFVRIRHYGLLAPSNRDKLRRVQTQLNGTPVPKDRKKKSYLQICAERGWEIGICPHCKCSMVMSGSFGPLRSPPSALRHYSLIENL